MKSLQCRLMLDRQIILIESSVPGIASAFTRSPALIPLDSHNSYCHYLSLSNLGKLRLREAK